jgi:hypothetical protein
VGRVWPRHGHRSRPLNLVVRLHANQRGISCRGSASPPLDAPRQNQPSPFGLRSAPDVRGLRKHLNLVPGAASRLTVGSGLPSPSRPGVMPTSVKFGGFGTCNLTRRWSGPWAIVARTLVANQWLAGSACGKRHRGRPLNSLVRTHLERSHGNWAAPPSPRGAATSASDAKLKQGCRRAPHRRLCRIWKFWGHL